MIYLKVQRCFLLSFNSTNEICKRTQGVYGLLSAKQHKYSQPALNRLKKIFISCRQENMFSWIKERGDASMVPTYIPMREARCGESSAMQSYLSSENPSSAHTKYPLYGEVDIWVSSSHFKDIQQWLIFCCLIFIGDQVQFTTHIQLL